MGGPPPGGRGRTLARASGAPAWRLHAIGPAVVLSGVLAACAAAPWDRPGQWVSVHVLAVGWAVAGSGMAAVRLAHAGGARPARSRDRLWPEVFAVGLVLLGLRGGWTDPMAPLAPTGTVVVAAILFGAVALRARSRPHEYVSGALVVLAAGLLWVTWGPSGVASLALMRGGWAVPGRSGVGGHGAGVAGAGA